MSGTGIPQPPAATPDSAAPSAANTAEAFRSAAPRPAARTLVPLDPPMLPFTIGGVAVWLVALLVTLPFRDNHESWFWICVAGLLWGIPGLLTMARHDARRKRRREAER